MKVHIVNYQKRPVNLAAIRRIARAVMQAEGCADNAEVSIVVCGDKRIRTLNRIWRGIDAPTDVLSFSQNERTSGPEFPIPDDDSPTIIGDVILSTETAARQTKESGISLEKELWFLLVHGLLHLMGWDHKTTAQLQRMLARQEEILKLV